MMHSLNKGTATEGLTERHLMLFGAIVQWYARHEVLIEEIMAFVAHSDRACIRLLTRNLTFAEKRNTLNDLLRHRNVPQDQVDRIYDFLVVMHTHNALLNDILHSTWTPGKPVNSVQPNWILGLPSTVKPMHGNGETLRGEFAERNEDRVSYSEGELRQIVELLGSNYDRFASYLNAAGLTHTREAVR